MKKIIMLLMLFASLLSQSALAAVYSVNLGSNTALNAYGSTWDPYSTIAYTNYSDYGFIAEGIDKSVSLINDVDFKGKITYLSGSNAYVAWDFDYITTSIPLYIYAYSAQEIPELAEMAGYGLGTLNNTPLQSGSINLAGQSYFYSVYSAVSDGAYMGAFYKSDLNALQITDTYTGSVPAPEPASMLLIGVGTALTAILGRRNRVV